jgi:hypothetical protein
LAGLIIAWEESWAEELEQIMKPAIIARIFFTGKQNKLAAFIFTNEF